MHVPISQRDGRAFQHGRTATHVAASLGDDHICYLLLARGAHPNAFDTFGRTGIFLAARHGHINCVKMLLAFGCDATMVDKNGKTAIEFAEEEAKEDEKVRVCIEWIKVSIKLVEYTKSRRPADQTRPLVHSCYVGEHNIHHYQGEGIMYLADGGYLEGEFVDSLASNHGILYRENGDVQYDGTWSLSMRSGRGRENHLGGGMFLGSWLNNKYDGFGKSFTERGDLIYEGGFRMGQRHGEGTLLRRDGTLEYEGSFSKGKMTGKGRRVRADGVSIIGYFLDGNGHGQAKVCNAKGQLVYDGLMQEGKKHGYGKIFRTNEDGKPLYFGEFKSDRYHGLGSLFLSEGQYVGQFKDGKAVGHGSFTFVSGHIFNGVVGPKGCLSVPPDYRSMVIDEEYPGRVKSAMEHLRLKAFELRTAQKSGTEEDARSAAEEMEHAQASLVVAKQNKFGNSEYNIFVYTARGDVDSLRWMLENHEDSRLTQRTAMILGNMTLLHIACYYGRMGCTRLLLSLGADINARDGNGMLPIDLGIMYKHDRCVSHILACQRLLKK